MNKINDNISMSLLFITGVAIYFIGVTTKQQPFMVLLALSITSVACWMACNKFLTRLQTVRVRR